MEKHKQIADGWILILHIAIVLMFNCLFILAFYLANPLIIYAIAGFNIMLMVWNIVAIKRILNSLVEERRMWQTAATYDSLTGVLNRGIFIQNLNREIQRSHRHGLNLTLLIFDLDHFKQINDTYGHSIGDAVLIKLCEKIKNTIRSIDSFGRLGGEEFGIMLPETDSAAAFILAERIRFISENMRVKDGLKATLSIGLTSLRKDDNVDSIYERADNALYSSKENGRNKVSIY